MKPTHDLHEIKRLIREKRFMITQRAEQDAFVDFGYGRDQIIETILMLNLNDLDQTMPSHSKPGSWQDVYKRHVLSGNRLLPAYIKLTITQQAVVISFHKA